MGKIKLVAFDLDDTLFNAKKEITPATLDTLNRAYDAGIELVPATGRFWDAVPENVKGLKINYAITVNGGEIFDIKAQKVLGRFEIPLERAITIARVLDDFPVIYDCVVDGFGYMRREYYEKRENYSIGAWQTQTLTKFRKPVDDIYKFLRERGRDVQKIQPFFMKKDYDLREKLLAALPIVFPKNIFSSSVPNNIEINDIHANKGDGLKFLADHLNISMQNVMAFGDGLNDIFSIRAAGVGVAMGNACQELKEIADYITSSCNDDGVAEGINKFCFGQ